MIISLEYTQAVVFGKIKLLLSLLLVIRKRNAGEAC